MSFPASQKILERLQGQKVRIPNLYSVLSGWHSAINPNEASIIPLIDEILEKYSFSASMTSKLRQAELPFFVSAWFPNASIAILHELTYFVCWMFLVDDQLDQLSGPSAADAEAFKSLTGDTIIFIEQCLGIQNASHKDPQKELYPGVQSFQETGEAIRKRYSLEQCKIFLEEARLTMSMYQVENDIRHAKRIPTNEEYWAYRQGSSCIGMVIAMIEFANQLCIPDHVIHDPDMEIIRTEGNRIHWILNDVVSAKKEIGGGFVENLVALCSGPDYNGQVGIDTAVEFIRLSFERFKAAEARLISRLESTDEQEQANGLNGLNSEQKLKAGDIKLARDVNMFIEGCKKMCVGNIDWSLRTARYGIHTAERDAEGGVLFTL